jgi:glycosyltransferase involved in cell wall biosynthesis
VSAPLRAGELVTPVILTHDEAPNIGRTLDCLTWARRVVIVDSGSTDGTRAIAAGHPNVSWHERAFDTHGGQWSHAIHETGITTPFVLALDADYQVPPAFVEELETRFLTGAYDGGIAGFEYAVDGTRLAGSVYPAKVVLFRPSLVRVTQPGHTQEIATSGSIYRFAARLVHDDRKPLERFIRSQLKYARLEAERLRGNGSLRVRDRLRRTGLMVAPVGLLAYVRAGGPFKGRAALRYACERLIFECLLVLETCSGGGAPPKE